MTQIDEVHGSMSAVEDSPFESGERTVSVDEAVRLHEIARNSGDVAVSVVVWPGQTRTFGETEVELDKDKMRVEISILTPGFTLLDLYAQLHDKPQPESPVE